MPRFFYGENKKLMIILKETDIMSGLMVYSIKIRTRKEDDDGIKR